MIENQDPAPLPQRGGQPGGQPRESGGRQNVHAQAHVLPPPLIAILMVLAAFPSRIQVSDPSRRLPVSVSHVIH